MRLLARGKLSIDDAGSPRLEAQPLPSIRYGLAVSRADSWHALPIETVLRRLKTTVSLGLSSHEASRRAAHFGPNVVQTAPRKKPKPWWRSIRWGAPEWSDHGWKWR